MDTADGPIHITVHRGKKFIIPALNESLYKVKIKIAYGFGYTVAKNVLTFTHSAHAKLFQREINKLRGVSQERAKNRRRYWKEIQNPKWKKPKGFKRRVLNKFKRKVVNKFKRSVNKFKRK